MHLIFAAKDNSQKLDAQIIKRQKLYQQKNSCYTVLYGNIVLPDGSMVAAKQNPAVPTSMLYIIWKMRTEAVSVMDVIQI